MQKFTKATIETDGTRAGTKITVNGKEVQDLASFRFSFWNDDYGSPVSLAFSVEDQSVEAGALREYKSYHLVPPQEQAEATVATAGVSADPTIQQMPSVPVELLPRSVDRRSLYAQI